MAPNWKEWRDWGGGGEEKKKAGPGDKNEKRDFP